MYQRIVPFNSNELSHSSTFTLQNLNMTTNHSNFTYNEFLAFMLVYAGGMDCTLTKEELEFIRELTKIDNIEKIKATVDSVNDIAAIDIIEDYRKKYLNTKEKQSQAKTDLENLLKTPGIHSQVEKASVHILEKLI